MDYMRVSGRIQCVPHQHDDSDHDDDDGHDDDIHLGWRHDGEFEVSALAGVSSTTAPATEAIAGLLRQKTIIYDQIVSPIDKLSNCQI